MSLIHGKVKQHIDGSMQKDAAVFSSITEIGHSRIILISLFFLSSYKTVQLKTILLLCIMA